MIYFLLVPVFAIAFFCPLAIVALYSLLGIYADAFGISECFSSIGLEPVRKFLGLPLFFAACWSSVQCFRSAGASGHAVGRRAVLVMLWICAGWVAVGSVVKTHTLGMGFTTLEYSGFLVAITCVASLHKRYAGALLLGIIFTQLLLAIILVTIPNSPIAGISATNYSQFSVGANELYEGGLARIDAGRMFAQFATPAGFGLYACFGAIFGLHLILVRTSYARSIFASLLIGFGVLGCMMTVTRGMMLGAAVGGVVILVASMVRQGIKAKTAVIVLLGIWGVAILLLTYNDDLLNVFNLKDDEYGLYSRAEALKTGIEHIQNAPFFGVATLVETSSGYLWPHQLPIYYAAANGAVVGILVAVLLLSPIVLSFFSLAGITRFPRTDSATIPMTCAVGLTLFATAMTNNTGTSQIFWAMVAVTWLPWLGYADKSGHLASEIKITKSRRNLRARRKAENKGPISESNTAIEC